MKFIARTSLLLASSLVLMSCISPVKEQHQAIVGDWRIAEIEGYIVDNKKAVMTFSKDGRVSGNNGCNSIGGQYNPVHDHLNLTKLLSTKKFCNSTANTDEQKFNNALPKIEHFLVNNDKLLLTDMQDKTVITLIR